MSFEIQATVTIEPQDLLSDIANDVPCCQMLEYYDIPEIMHYLTTHGNYVRTALKHSEPLRDFFYKLAPQPEFPSPMAIVSSIMADLVRTLPGLSITSLPNGFKVEHP